MDNKADGGPGAGAKTTSANTARDEYAKNGLPSETLSTDEIVADPSPYAIVGAYYRNTHPTYGTDPAFPALTEIEFKEAAFKDPQSLLVKKDWTMDRLLQVERARVAEVFQAMKRSSLDDAYAAAYALYPLIKGHADSDNALARELYGTCSAKLASELNLANHDDESNALFCSYQIRKWKKLRRKADTRRQEARSKSKEAAEKKRLEEARMTQDPKKPTKTPKSFSLTARDFVQRHLAVIAFVVIPILLICCLFGMVTCYGPNASHNSTSTNSATSSQPDKTKSTKDTSDSSSTASEKAAKNAQAKAPDPVDPDWPTRNATLLAVPESERYYNAYKYVGERHRVVGPVVSVKYAAQSNGQPTFIDIGKPYPSDERFTFVIWGEDMDEGLYEMVTEVQAGNAWLSVEGTIETYKGLPEIQTGKGTITYQWWS